MTSIVAICNLALSNIGKENISSLAEESAEARACRQFYGHTRDILLQGFPWKFAAKTAILAEVANDRPGQWSHAYARPVDCLKVRGVRPYLNQGYLSEQDRLAIPYKIDGGIVYSNEESLVMLYTHPLDDPTQYSPLFVEAFSWQLAVRLAMPLTRDPSVRADALRVARDTTGTASELDASEEHYSYWVTTDLIEGR